MEQLEHPFAAPAVGSLQISDLLGGGDRCRGLGSIGGVGAGFLGLALGVLGGTESSRLPSPSALDMNRGGRASRTSVCGNHMVDVIEVDGGPKKKIEGSNTKKDKNKI